MNIALTIWEKEDLRQRRLEEFLRETSWNVNVDIEKGNGFKIPHFSISSNPSAKEHIISYNFPAFIDKGGVYLSIETALLAEKIHPAFSTSPLILVEIEEEEVTEESLILEEAEEYLKPIILTSILYLAGELIEERFPDIWRDYLILNMEFLQNVEPFKSSPTIGDIILSSSIVASIRKHLDPNYSYPDEESISGLMKIYEKHREIKKEKLLSQLLSLTTNMAELFGYRIALLSVNGTTYWLAERNFKKYEGLS